MGSGDAVAAVILQCSHVPASTKVVPYLSVSFFCHFPLILAVYSRTWQNERSSSAFFDGVLSVGRAVNTRQVTSILIKRQHINLGWDADDKYGHWWFEIGNPSRPDSESYGWWPKHPVTARATLMGTEGELNGQTSFGGTLTRDPHHGDQVKHSFHPVVAIDESRTDAEIIECLRSFAIQYSGDWRWTIGWGQNCHSFQADAMEHCGLQTPERSKKAAP